MKSALSYSLATLQLIAHVHSTFYGNSASLEDYVTNASRTLVWCPKQQCFVKSVATDSRHVVSHSVHNPRRLRCTADNCEGSVTASLGVRDFKIHWISHGFRISDWCSGFQSGFLDLKVDFYISKWISGFQSGFLHFKVDSGFCLVILKILLMNNVFLAQMHTEYNVTGTSVFYRYAASIVCIHVLTCISLY